MKNIKSLIGQLPFQLTDFIEDNTYYLHIARTGEKESPHWLAYYGTDDDHDIEEVELVGNGKTAEEALLNLANGVREYEKSKLEARHQSDRETEES